VLSPCHAIQSLVILADAREALRLADVALAERRYKVRRM
jgi:hypothetical protein